MNPTADLKNDRQMGPVSIGRGTYWQNGRFITDVFPGNHLKIGRYCSIGPDVRIVAGGGHVMTFASTWPLDHFLKGATSGGRTDPPPHTTDIGSDVWIGAGAQIGGGVKIGHGAVIGGAPLS